MLGGTEPFCTKGTGGWGGGPGRWGAARRELGKEVTLMAGKLMRWRETD